METAGSREQSVGGQQVVGFQVPAGAGRAEGAKQGHRQFLTRRAAGRRPYGGRRAEVKLAFKTNLVLFIFSSPHVFRWSPPEKERR